ncbi:MAG: hypothetical protein E7414_06120 [Ruminococcaceae bacterium]|nr:hypothetical protein [Oscillospiraceae bacterium]
MYLTLIATNCAILGVAFAQKNALKSEFILWRS